MDYICISETDGLIKVDIC